jgi:hypothetical protein
VLGPALISSLVAAKATPGCLNVLIPAQYGPAFLCVRIKCVNAQTTNNAQPSRGDLSVGHNSGLSVCVAEPGQRFFHPLHRWRNTPHQAEKFRRWLRRLCKV